MDRADLNGLHGARARILLRKCRNSFWNVLVHKTNELPPSNLSMLALGSIEKIDSWAWTKSHLIVWRQAPGARGPIAAYRPGPPSPEPARCRRISSARLGPERLSACAKRRATSLFLPCSW